MFYKHALILLRKKLLLIVALGCCFPVMIRAQRSVDSKSPGSGSVTITVDISKRYQSIDNFAASDAWACQFVGNWPDEKRNAIADLLFSKKLLPNGKPQGIGLSMWRFNIGAGSTQQRSESGIKDEWRRAESFFEKGQFNWKLQAGQMWFLEAAKKRGVDQFLAFTNSPPVHLTANGKAFATGAKPNLHSDNFDAFAEFLVEVVKGVKNKTGVLFNYLSPVNEPQWDWSDGGQEGTPFLNKDVSGIVRSLNDALIKAKLNTKIAVAEAAQYDFLYSDFEKPGKGQQINTFFNPSSADFIGDLLKVDKVISGHSYFTTSPYNKAERTRKEVKERISLVNGLKFWQSEYCILGDNEGEIKGEKRDLGIRSGIYLAKVIHNDLVNANASAWHWWTAVSAYDYKDGLVYVDKNIAGGEYYQSKMLWVLGNYSRFIRPGAARVDVNIPEISRKNEILVLSFIDQQNKELITVLVNHGFKPVNVSLHLKKGKLVNQNRYVTSEDLDLEPNRVLDASDEIKLEAQTVTTVVSEIKY